MSLILWPLAALIFACALTPWLPKNVRAFDLASHFAPQHMMAALVLLALSAAFRPHGGIYLFLFSAYFLSLYRVYPYMLPPREAAKKPGTALKILQANVWVKNTATEPFRNLIRAENPDLIIVAEANGAFAALFRAMEDEYPHQHVDARDASSFGIAVLSRFPLEDMEQKHLATENIPSVFFRITRDGKAASIAALHAANPTRDLAARNAEFSALAAWYADTKPANLVVAGDLNATPWCRAFRDLIHQAHLADPRERRGFLGTFPARAPLPFLRLPIDHALATPGVSFEDFRVGPNIGSDHLPTISVIKF